MAINKDPGDTRTYTANKTLNFDMEASATPNALATVSSNIHTNWAGQVADINVPYVAVAFYTTTFWSEDAATIQTSNSSSTGFITSAYGLTLGTSLDHAQVPGMHMAPFSVEAESSGNTVYYKVMHATSNSGTQSFTRS